MRRQLARLFAVLALWAPVSALGGSSELETKWDSALEALEQQDYPGASRLLESWVTDAGAAGMRSSQAHYNLGLALWEQKRPGQAVYHFLTSVSLAGPFDAMNLWSSLGQIQRELGIRDNVAEDPLVRAASLVSPGTVGWLATLGIWGVVFAFLTWWSQGNRALKAATQIAILPAILLILSAAGYSLRFFAPPLGVLAEDDSNTVTVYRVPEEQEANKLVDLPLGTIVVSGRVQGEFVEIQEPVIGWVGQSVFRPVVF